jgi:hypothetical protein
MHPPSTNGSISSAHRVPSFSHGPGFQQYDHRGKRQLRQHHNSHNRNHNAQPLPHRNHYAHSNGFENMHQVPAQDWTMWTGNR